MTNPPFWFNEGNNFPSRLAINTTISSHSDFSEKTYQLKMKGFLTSGLFDYINFGIIVRDPC